MNALKAATCAEQSTAIVVSFDGRWTRPLVAGDVRVVFRKRGPKAMQPSFIYAYVGIPHSHLIGRMKATSCKRLTVAEALPLVSEAGLTENDLREYLRGYTHVFAYAVGRLQKTKHPLPLAQLAETFGFSPPQSFFILSQSGKNMLDRAAGFATE